MYDNTDNDIELSLPLTFEARIYLIEVNPRLSRMKSIMVEFIRSACKSSHGKGDEVWHFADINHLDSGSARLARYCRIYAIRL